MLSEVDLLDAYSRAVISVVDTVGPAVVGVSGIGTGMLITPDGYALTNSHVASAVKTYELTLRDGTALKAELEAYLRAGPPPIVFTLGSSVSMYATGFFMKAIEAARRLRHRALLVTGQDPAQYDGTIASAGLEPRTIKVMRYLPYSEAFPHAAVNVHQGGVGTLAQALAAGRPQLVIPVGFDQPDNARRVERLGLSKSIAFQKLTAGAMTEALRELLSSPSYASSAAAVALTVNAEERDQRAAELLSFAGREVTEGNRGRFPSVRGTARPEP